MRKAGDLIAQMLRSVDNKNNRKAVGEGSYGVVYESDTPGYVVKEARTFAEDLTREADFQSIAADMGFAPRVSAVESSPFDGDILEMQDARPNFELHRTNRQFPTGTDAVRVNQQLGALALKGVDLDDRHTGNIMYNKMTGRPLQLDFGKSRNVTGEDQVAALTNATEAGFAAAGLGDVARIYSDTVYDLLAGGDVAEAMDIAKQGFSRLQKIKGPLA